MFCDIGCRPTILATQRQALNQAQGQQQQRRQEADARVSGQQADGHRRTAHEDDSHEEGIFAPDEIADAPEDDGPEGAYEEPRGICGKGREQRRRIIAFGEEQRGEEGR